MTVLSPCRISMINVSSYRKIDNQLDVLGNTTWGIRKVSYVQMMSANPNSRNLPFLESLLLPTLHRLMMYIITRAWQNGLCERTGGGTVLLARERNSQK